MWGCIGGILFLVFMLFLLFFFVLLLDLWEIGVCVEGLCCGGVEFLLFDIDCDF